MDSLTSARRSEQMARIRSGNTGPELKVRKILHRIGYRFRLHRRDLPGTPDIVLPRHRVAIFVHGCFWHGHDCRRGAREPKTNADYWRNKRSRNRRRDDRAQRELVAQGWRVLVLWECDLGSGFELADRLAEFIDSRQLAPSDGAKF